MLVTSTRCYITKTLLKRHESDPKIFLYVLASLERPCPIVIARSFRIRRKVSEVVLGRIQFMSSGFLEGLGEFVVQFWLTNLGLEGFEVRLVQI